jgi:glycosyltransferase involved in cell wall biosynthesis
MIAEAVGSTQAQSFKNFELIVVDDGSTDGTAEKLQRFGAHVRVISRPRGGVATARNQGVKVAGGQYVAFLDSDDLWLPKKLEIQTAFMAKHSEIEISQTEEIWIRNGVRVNPKKKHRKPSGDIFRRSLDLCLVSPSSVMMTKDLFDRAGGFDERFPVCEDYDLWLRIALEHEVALIPTALVVKRGGHPDQLSRSLWGIDRFRVAALRKLLRSGLDGERRDWAIDALKRKVSIFCQGARNRGREQEAVRYEASLAEFCEESLDVRRADSRVCEGQEFSSTDPGALVALE